MLNTDILLTLKINNQLFADAKRITLLKAIYQMGSLSQAARSIGMSYKSAWDAINDINTLSEKPFVQTLTGGKGGGGATLSPYGIRFVEMYDLLTKMQTNAFNILSDETLPLNDILKVAAKVSLQSSARNQFYGVITSININEVAGFITVLLQDKQTEMTAYITHSSIERLNLMIGKEVILLVKAPQIELLDHADCNHYLTHVDSFVRSKHWGELTLSLASGINIYASRAIEEFKRLTIEHGSPLSIYINPENIIVATIV